MPTPNNEAWHNFHLYEKVGANLNLPRAGYNFYGNPTADSTYVLECDGLAKGTYYLRLYQSGDQGTGYKLDYTFTPCPYATDAEPNDKINNAVLLQSGQQVSGRLSYQYQDYTDYTDWYKIEVAEAGKVAFAWHLPNNKDYWHQFHLFEFEDDSFSRVGYSFNGTSTTDSTYLLECDGLAKGTYYLKLYRSGNTGMGYKLDYTFTPNPFVAGKAVHNSFSTRTKLEYGEQYGSAMGFTYQRKKSADEEWYEFDTDGLNTLTLKIDRNKNVDLHTELFRVEGTNDDGTPKLYNVLTNSLEGLSTALTYEIPEADRRYGTENYLGPTRTVDYRILFENKAEASAPAYRVRIFNKLDPEVFDVESVQFGTTSHDDPQYQWKMTREGNQLFWDIEGIELPPNVHAPEGEGYVTYSVRLKPNLPDGQVIANKATIVFDKNTPIETNTYSNKLDLVAPQTQQIQANYQKGASNIGLNFMAQEQGSGVAGYLLYVAKNGSEYEFFAQCNGSEVIFAVDQDQEDTYSFYAIAIDNVGNTEEQNDIRTMVQTQTGIPSILNNESSEVVAIYGPDGRRTTTLQLGVNILKMKNGTSVKVMVR